MPHQAFSTPKDSAKRYTTKKHNNFNYLNKTTGKDSTIQRTICYG